MAGHLHICGLCRGPSHAFVALRARGVVGRVVARARIAGTQRLLPVLACELEGADARLLVRATGTGVRAWVLALPLLMHVTVELVGEDATVVATATLPAAGSRVASRLLTLTRPSLASLMRSVVTRMAGGRTTVQLIWGSPASVQPESPNVWRFAVSYATDDASMSPQLVVYNARGKALPAAPVVLEDHVVPTDASPALMERLVTFSVSLPARVASFYVVATLEGADDPVATAGFAVVFAEQGRHFLEAATRAQTGVVGDDAYGAWLATQRVSVAELAAQRRLAAGAASPRISVVMPVYQPEHDHFAAAVASVASQSWQAWELIVVNACEGAAYDYAAAVLATHAGDERIRVVRCKNTSIAENTNLGIAAAAGDYVAFMDHDDVLEPDALWCYAHAIGERPEADLIYCDEDRIVEDDCHRWPAFKAGPSLGKLYGYNYVKHLLMVSRRVLELTERSSAGVSGAQDLDLTLKAFEVARDIVHIPRVLYHWRDHPGSTVGATNAKPYAHEAGRLAISEHLARRRLAATVDDGPMPYTYRVRFELPEPPPCVSVVIPSSDHAGLLRSCLTSLLEKTDYPRYEVVVVENGSTLPETFALYDELSQDPRIRIVCWEPPEGGTFSYAAACNFGAAAATGDVLLFLNNDTEVIDGSWMREMVGCLARPEVAVVGARLVFPDGLLQHAGIVATPEGDFMHASGGIAADALGYGYAAAFPADVEMVTGACQLVRRCAFEAVGGFDEKLAIGFNDGDLCLRVRSAGHLVVYCPYATLVHREFASRGRETLDVRLRKRYLCERSRFVQVHADALASGAICCHPALDPVSPLPRLSWP